MSYSFAVRAATKAEAREKIAAEFDRAEVAQRCHVTDRAAAQAAALAFVDDFRDRAAHFRFGFVGHFVDFYGKSVRHQVVQGSAENISA